MASEMIGNRYIIVKLIGSGGMADVYLAIDSILKREVAIKVLRGELASDPINLTRFQKEAMVISNTSHPNIVEIYDVGSDGQKNYIVMEYVHGKTLKQLIKQRGSLPIDEAVNIMKQLVSAVSHAHKVGIIHRDIKSQNVLVKDDGTVKLSDFGIAYTGEATQLTKTDTIMGSVHYLAPELCVGEICTPQSDIYSLGIVFYEMLTGNVPYHGEQAVEIALKHMHNDIPSVKQYNPLIPQSVENIVIKAAARNKNYRYENADEMYNDLVTCLDLTRNNESKINLKKVNEQNTTKKAVEKKSIDFSAIVIIFFAVVLAAVILIAIITLTTGGNSNTDQVVVPNVYEYSLADAQTSLISSNIQIGTISYEPSNDVEKGKVIRTSPAIGTSVNKNTYITIVVSEGKNYTMENFVGKPIDASKATLEKYGFQVFVSEVSSSEASTGIILSQSVEEGKLFEPSDVKIINFTVAKEPADYIPEIIGMDIEKARTTLENLGFKIEMIQMNVEENIDENGEYIYPLLTVVSSDPNSGEYYTQTASSTIKIYYY